MDFRIIFISIIIIHRRKLPCFILFCLRVLFFFLTLVHFVIYLSSCYVCMNIYIYIYIELIVYIVYCV
jgi:hypothetical protein